MNEMDERFRALADFMEWVDPEGYTEVLAAESAIAGKPPVHRRCPQCGWPMKHYICDGWSCSQCYWGDER